MASVESLSSLQQVALCAQAVFFGAKLPANCLGPRCRRPPRRPAGGRGEVLFSLGG